MIHSKCIQKFRNKLNQIICYRLQDLQGNTKDVTPQQLKQAIQNNQINIINLTLTSDNRLIDTQSKQTPQQTLQQTLKNKKAAPKQQFSLLTREIVEQINRPKALEFQSNKNLEVIDLKATMLCYATTQLSNDFLLLENNNELILVSNKQIQLDNTQYDTGLFEGTNFASIDFHNTDTSNNTDMRYMFHECAAQTLDLSSFNTSNVTNMESLFEGCQAQTIDLSSFNTSNVTNMSSMFYECEAQTLDLSSFDTSNVTDMKLMFAGCQAQTLDLSSFDTSNVTDMRIMFRECQAQTINLSSFDTSKVTDMKHMFDGCQAQTLDLSSFDTSKVTNMEYMFWCCQSQTIDLSNFNTSNVKNMIDMFVGCKAQIKTTDTKLNRYK